MTRTLLIRLPEDATSNVPWVIFDDDSQKIVDEGVRTADQTLFSSGEIIPERIWVLVPGTAVTVRTVQIPAMNDTRAREVVSFALEDDIAGNRDDLHFALGKRRANQRAVGYVARVELESWLQRLLEIGVKPTAMIPDFLSCPMRSESTTVIEHDGFIMGRFVDGGFSIERGIFTCIAADLLPAAGTINVHAHDSDDLGLAGAIDGERLVRAPAYDARGLFQAAYTTLSNGVPLNLLQEQYAPRRAWTFPGSHWRRAAMLAGAAVALSIALQVVDSIRLNGEADAAYLRADAVFREVMPQGTRLMNARTQMRAHTDKLSAVASNMFLQISGLLYAGVSAVEGVEIDSLRFDRTRSEVAASLSLPSFDAMEQIAEVVSSGGGILQEGGARQQGERISADVTVRIR